jgi:hypothetical protein
MWVTWRQFRGAAIAASILLAVPAIALAVTGPHIAQLYRGSGVATCTARTCAQLTTQFLNEVPPFDQILYALCLGIMFVIPAVIGVFWGAPLISREIEARTLGLAWNQSVTRTRWLAWKLGMTGLAVMATTGLLSLMVTWWSSPADSALEVPYGHRISFQRLAPVLFATRAIAPVGYAAFALVLGVLAGVMLRRTVPAMAVTLGAFFAIGFIWPNWIRPYLIPAVHTSRPLTLADFQQTRILSSNTMTVLGTGQLGQPGAWVLSSQVVDQAGHPYIGPATQACLDASGPTQCFASLARLHLRQVFSYQPAGRFWDFQWYETAVFAGFALLLAGCCFLLVNRRRTVVLRPSLAL